MPTKTSAPTVVSRWAAFRGDRVLKQTYTVCLRNLLFFFSVTAVADLPNLLIRKAAPVTTFWSMPKLVEVFIFVVTSALAEAVVLHAAFEDMRGRRPDPIRSLHVALARARPLIGVALFMAFGIVVGGFFLIVPALFLLTIWYVATPACVVERLSVRGSIDRSMQLTRGHRFKIFGMVVMLFVVDALGAEILNVALRQGGALVSTAGNFVWSAAWGALYAVFGVVTYQELRIVKEGVDIHQIASVFD